MKFLALIAFAVSLFPAVASAGLLDRLPFGGKDKQLAAETERNDARLAINAVAWPLLTHPALLERCEGGRPSFGFARIGLDGIEMDHAPAYDALGLVPRQILAVYPGSPAADAGLLPGDVVTRVNGKRLRDSLRGENRFTTLLDDARDDGEPVTLDIDRKGRAIRLTVAPVAACDYESVVGGALGAGGGHTLPRKVRVRALTVDIALYRAVAEDRGALQAVVVHELAHQFAGHHRTRSLASGIGRGLDVALGAVGGISTGGALGMAGGIAFKAAEEREADALALDLTAALGHAPDAYAALVRRLASAKVDLLATVVGAHPVDAERLAALPATEG